MKKIAARNKSPLTSSLICVKHTMLVFIVSCVDKASLIQDTTIYLQPQASFIQVYEVKLVHVKGDEKKKTVAVSVCYITQKLEAHHACLYTFCQGGFLSDCRPSHV